MYFKQIRFWALCGVLLGSPLLTGCEESQFSSTILNPLNLKLPFLPYQKPLRIGIAHDGGGVFDPSKWELKKVGSPWTPLREKLQDHLKTPVQIEDLKPFQVAAHLQSGRLDFAFLCAEDYLEMHEEFGELGEVVAISEVMDRQGLIVASAKSSINSMADIRGKRFAFGPKDDEVLDIAATEALESGGVPIEDIQKELLPVPNSLQYHVFSVDVAREVVYGLGTEAGVIERSEYESYADTGGSMLPLKFAKDDFRVLGETESVRMDTISEGPFLASPETDQEMVERVKNFLLESSDARKPVLARMGLAGFRTPPEDVDSEMERLVAMSGQPPAEPVEENE